MNESTEKAVERGLGSGGKNADTTSTDAVNETENQRKAETVNAPEADSAELTAQRGLPLDQTFEILRNQRRRYVLQHLEAVGEQVSLSELAEQIAAWENDKEVRQITSSERKRVYVGLYQCHLPKMDGMGVISFNKPRGLIERGENADAVEPYLQRAAVSDRSSWTKPRVVISILGLTVLPAAILLQSQTMLSLVLAVTVVVVATLGGVAMLLRSDADEDVALDGRTVS
jgi:hypothetical protein